MISAAGSPRRTNEAEHRIASYRFSTSHTSIAAGCLRLIWCDTTAVVVNNMMLMSSLDYLIDKSMDYSKYILEYDGSIYIYLTVILPIIEFTY
jgi:hypothetical protein